jgi:ABC-2 type transport system permease protein
VLGVGLLGLGQNVLLAVAGGTAAVATGVLSLSIGGAAGVLGLGLLWYVVGFFTFALLFAAIGALVSRQEEVGGAVSPLLMIIIVPYVLAVSILPNNPGSPLVAVLSVVPFASPMTMPERIAIGSASAWQVVLAFALAVVAAVAVVRITGRIYGNAVLRSGARVRLRDALRPQ